MTPDVSAAALPVCVHRWVRSQPQQASAAEAAGKPRSHFRKAGKQQQDHRRPDAAAPPEAHRSVGHQLIDNIDLSDRPEVPAGTRDGLRELNEETLTRLLFRKRTSLH